MHRRRTRATTPVWKAKRGGNIGKDVTNSAPKFHRDARSAAKLIETSNNEDRRFGAQSARRNMPVTSLETLSERCDVSRRTAHTLDISTPCRAFRTPRSACTARTATSTLHALPGAVIGHPCGPGARMVCLGPPTARSRQAVGRGPLIPLPDAAIGVRRLSAAAQAARGALRGRWCSRFLRAPFLAPRCRAGAAEKFADHLVVHAVAVPCLTAQTMGAGCTR